MWALVSSVTPIVQRRFWVVGTGHPVPRSASYVGTAHCPPFVWHVFAPDPTTGEDDGRVRTVAEQRDDLLREVAALREGLVDCPDCGREGEPVRRITRSMYCPDDGYYDPGEASASPHVYRG